MTETKHPEIQLTSNVVILNDAGEVLLTRYDSDDERWWIPGASLTPYEHPDQAANRALQDVAQVAAATATMDHVESFRGRRGWHVMFNYRARLGAGEAQPATAGSQWFRLNALPSMMHGEWEKTVIAAINKA